MNNIYLSLRIKTQSIKMTLNKFKPFDKINIINVNIKILF